jgi:hypothetical protein
LARQICEIKQNPTMPQQLKQNEKKIKKTKLLCANVCTTMMYGF